MIISGGVNLYPQEIEAVLAECPGVSDCGVVGLPDERFGERPHAFVVPDAASSSNAAAFLASVQQTLQQQLGRTKWPAQVHLCSELPRSATGKLLRRQLSTLIGPAASDPSQL